MSLSFKRIKRKLRNKIWRFFFYREVSSFEKQYTIGFLETLEKIHTEQLSLARFGDGELNLLCMESIKFQNSSTDLSHELKNVLHTKINSLLVCLPTFLDSDIPKEDTFWTNFWCEHWKMIHPFFNANTIYGKAQISRPECFEIHQTQATDAWKKIWADRDVCFITGQGSRFDTEHSLFDNIISKQTIYSLSENAYNDIDRLYNEVLTKISPSSLILCALGPTSTVLAYRLAQSGYQILDIGHLPNSYDRVFKNGLTPEQVTYTKN